jgi:hypothetical protein
MFVFTQLIHLHSYLLFILNHVWEYLYPSLSFCSSLSFSLSLKLSCSWSLVVYNCLSACLAACLLLPNTPPGSTRRSTQELRSCALPSPLLQTLFRTNERCLRSLCNSDSQALLTLQWLSCQMTLLRLIFCTNSVSSLFCRSTYSRVSHCLRSRLCTVYNDCNLVRGWIPVRSLHHSL